MKCQNGVLFLLVSLVVNSQPFEKQSTKVSSLKEVVLYSACIIWRFSVSRRDTSYFIYF